MMVMYQFLNQPENIAESAVCCFNNGFQLLKAGNDPVNILLSKCYQNKTDMYKFNFSFLLLKN